MTARVAATTIFAAGAPHQGKAKSPSRSRRIGYGIALEELAGSPGCLELSQVLERMTLRVPKDVHRA
jgi:hypothetical protein